MTGLYSRIARREPSDPAIRAVLWNWSGFLALNQVKRWLWPLRKPLGRLVRRFSPAAQVQADPAVRGALNAAFDRAYYLQRNPDVAAAGIDPLDHFLSFGWKEHRDPSADFSVQDYRELNPDVTSLLENPFLHFVSIGQAEGRAAKRRLGFRHDILAKLLSMEDRLAGAQGRSVAYPAGSGADLAKALAGLNAKTLHLTVSHDDYSANLGGLQLCLQQEAKAFADQGADHLHIYPANPYPILRTEGQGDLLGLLVNGDHRGFFSAVTLAAGFGKGLAKPRARRTLAVHSLLGHTIGDVLPIVAAAGLTEGVFWLHDFASLCAGFHLTRNDVTDCGAPPPDSAACGVCIYGPYRAAHMQAHRTLFEALALTVVAPSQPTLDLWLRAGDLPYVATRVLPHLNLTDPRPAAPRAEGPLRVAFLGMANAHKGWPVFQDLALRFRDDPRYAFLHLGKGAGAAVVDFHEAMVSPEHPFAMKERVEELEVDVALVWPLCRETFGLTAYEAVAAGAALLTHPDTGNVAAYVASGAPGRVVQDETELGAIFESGEVLDLSRAMRQSQISALTFSRMSADIVGKRSKV